MTSTTTADPDTGWSGWTAHFERNRARHAELEAGLDWDAPVTMTERERRRWGASLARFQIGESGDGQHLLRTARDNGESLYATAAALFVAEEQQHARLLGELLDRLGAPRMTGHWSDTAFVAARRLMGVPVELAVIDVAEAVALVYYDALARLAPDPVVRAVASRILEDERVHVRFHRERIAQDLGRWGPARRNALRLLWWATGVGATAVVALDHAGVLAGAGASRRGTVAAVHREIARVRREVYRAPAARVHAS